MKILVVDDNLEIINLLQSSLRPEGFAVDIATDGEKGISMGLTNDYDLILLDYNLPKKDGFVVCRELRKEGKTMPILILSVRSEINDKVSLLDAGADDYLTKPFSVEELLARVRVLLRRPLEIQPQCLRVGDLILCKESFSIKRGEKNVYLTPKEFSLLKYLVENKGKILSRVKIMENVWDKEANLLSNTVEAHILNLRKKIDNDYEVKLIKTFPNRGYKISED